MLKGFPCCDRDAQRRILVLLGLLCLPSPAFAGLDEAVGYYRAGQYVAAAAEFESLGADPIAHYFLGMMYLEGGSGLSRNSRRARGHFQEAAQQGHPESQAELGRLFLQGLGTRKDPKAAKPWIEMAAQQGVPAAQYNLGLMYLQGRGVGKDPQKAATLFEKAAQQNYPQALTNLAIMAHKGEGQPQDQAKARDLFEKAAKHGHTQAMVNLAQMLEKGQGGSPDRIKATAWYGTAAALRNSQAMAPHGQLTRRLSSAEKQQAKNLTAQLVQEARLGAQKTAQAKMTRRLAQAKGATASPSKPVAAAASAAAAKPAPKRNFTILPSKKPTNLGPAVPQAEEKPLQAALIDPPLSDISEADLTPQPLNLGGRRPTRADLD